MKAKNDKQTAKKKGSTPKRNFWQGFESITTSKWAIGLMLVVISIVFYTNYSRIYDPKIDLGGDNIVYYSLGRALSQGEGYTNTITLDKTPHTHFPPGYPFFISKVISVFPDNITTVKIANAVLLYLSLVLLFFVIFLTTRNSILALCACILAAMHKSLLRFATVMMSETLFIFLSLLAILIVLLVVKQRIGAKRKWVFWIVAIAYGFLIAYMYLVRTMGVSLILSLAFWLGIITIRELIKWRRSLKTEVEKASSHKQLFIKSLLLCVITLAAMGTAKMSWDARNRSVGREGSDYQATFYKKTNNEDMEGWSDWKARIKSNSASFVLRRIPEVTYMKKVVADPQKNEHVPFSTKEWVLGILLLFLFIAGSLNMDCGRILMLTYIAITVGVLILYPEQYGGTRYITPIVPLFIFLALNGISAIVAVLYKIFKFGHSPLLVQSIAILLCTFAFLIPKYTEAQTETKNMANLKSWKDLPTNSLSNVNVVRFINASEYCRDSLPEDARIVCRKPELFYMFSGYRPSKGFPKYAEPDTIYNMLCRDSINYIIIDNWFRHAFVTLHPCVKKHPEKFKLIKHFGDLDSKDNAPTLIYLFNDYWGYHGEMKDGVAEGQGVFHMQDGRTYEGAFSNGKPNGWGTMYDAKGNEIVQGEWHDGTIHYMKKR